jgi:Ca-activated chloride channel homolog
MNFVNDLIFQNPSLLFALIIVPLIALFYFWKERIFRPAIGISAISHVAEKQTLKTRTRHTPFILKLIALALMIIALARPQSRNSFQDIKTEGIDIVLAMDVSASMLARDFKPDRLEASKRLAMSFIDSRPNDRIGLVVFSGESFTQCPLTTDHAVLKNLFAGLKTGMIKDGTAIGLGLANAISRLEKSNAKSKVVILLTDGVNNQGSIAPLTAAELAKPFNIRVYTIGVGTRGKAPTPVGLYPDGTYAFDYVDVDVDDKTLTQIAEMNGGRYFRATSNEKLKEIYKEIDKMEKTVIEEKQYSNRTELFLPFLLAAFALILIEFILSRTYYRSIT